jgi:hypothetical protein
MPDSRSRLPNARLVYWLLWMLPHVSSRSGTLLRLFHQVENLARHEAFEAANDLEVRVSLGGLPGDVGLGPIVGANPNGSSR